MKQQNNYQLKDETSAECCASHSLMATVKQPSSSHIHFQCPVRELVESQARG